MGLIDSMHFEFSLGYSKVYYPHIQIAAVFEIEEVPTAMTCSARNQTYLGFSKHLQFSVWLLPNQLLIDLMLLSHSLLNVFFNLDPHLVDIEQTQLDSLQS